MTSPNTIIADMQAEIYALKEKNNLLVYALTSIDYWCYPDASTMPNDKVARLEWYARRLVVIANAAKSAIDAA